MNDRPAVLFPRIKLSHFHKLINLTMSRLFAAHGCEITREQEVILRELRQEDGIAQVELALRSGQDRNNLSRTLDILEAKRLVARGRSRQDRRSSLVHITDAGRALHETAYRAVNDYRRILFQGCSQDEVDAFADMVRRLSDNLEGFLGETAADRPAAAGEEVAAARPVAAADGRPPVP
ncbi:MAG: MarR family transcriptional regulator [Rhodobacteraceae bacterium]|nr:MarR family transcriptional regulator [Paracoccaceae bacterium]